MTRPYGKRPKTNRGGGGKTPDNAAFKVKMRGRDGAPLEMREVQQGLFELAHRLGAHQDFRVKWCTLYMTVVDEHGDEVVIDQAGEWVLHPYHSAADELGA